MNPQILAHYERYLAPWLPPAVTLLLVVAIGWTLSGLVWAVVPPPADLRWTPAPVTTADKSAARAAGADVQAIARAHLFGEFVEPKAEAVRQEILDAPETRLNLTLTGILAATESRGSRALIAQGDGEEAPYAVGDLITRGVTLEQIFADRVILSRGGQLETLRLDKDSPSSFAPNSPVAPLASADASGRTIDGQDAYRLAQIRQELLANPAKASDYLRVQPARIGGVMRGYRIYPGRDRSIFSSAGLRPGDLVTAVNGVELDDPAKALQLLGDLSQANALTVTIERGGNQQTINVNLN